MPNWCNNEIQVTGDEDKLQEFKQFVQGDYYHGIKCGSLKIWSPEVKDYVDNPNYCGGEEFLDTCDKMLNEFSFHSILPMPPELRNTTSPVDIYETQADIDAYLEELKNQDNYNEHDGFFKSKIAKCMTREYSDHLKVTYGADNWYDWSYEKWGTKWDAGSVALQDDGWMLQYDFDTAWCPPEPIHAFLVDRFPDLNISWFYREDGMEMAGYL